MISIETRQLSSMEGTAIDREAVCFLPYVFFFLKEKKRLGTTHRGFVTLLCFFFFIGCNGNNGNGDQDCFPG